MKSNETVLDFVPNDVDSTNRQTFTPNESPFIDSGTVKSHRFSPLHRQIFTSSGPIVSAIASGAVAGYSAVLLPQLQRPESGIMITQEEASWIASMAPLLMAVGCIGGGISMERYGRKFSQLIGYIPFILGWILIATSSNLNCMLAGRFLTGFCAGWLGASLFVYIAEVTNPMHRGPLLACTSLGISTGILFVHVLGTFFSWTLTAAICSCLPVVCFVILAMCPESPAWLLSRGRVKEAAMAFIWLRGSGQEACAEFESMVKGQNISAAVSNYSWVNFVQNIRKPEFVKPLFILSIFMLIMQFSGTNAVTFYSIAIFRQTFGLSLDEYMVMIVVDVVRVICSAIGCIVLKRYGRRTIAILSTLGTAITLFALSSFIYITTKFYVDIPSSPWILLAFLLMYIACISIGLVPVPWCMIGELLPLSLRGLGSSLTSSICFLWFFTVVKTSPALFGVYGADGAFLMYGMVALFGTAFLALFLPETRNRTLQEIEDHFKSND